MADRTPVVGGNWKMNTSLATGPALAAAVARGCGGRPGHAAEVVVFPPFPYLLPVRAEVEDEPIRLGAQDLHPAPKGAFTGEVSAAMLRDVGVEVVLAGHSERRHVMGEPDELVNRKVHAALDAGLDVVLCIGETLEQREAGSTDAVNAAQLEAGLAGVTVDQLARLVIAYEPVWAIGTGRTASPADAQAAHRAIRDRLAAAYDPAASEAMRIQYGGSVKPGNAAELISQPDVDGFLVGGASLDADDFLAIIDSALTPSTPSPTG